MRFLGDFLFVFRRYRYDVVRSVRFGVRVECQKFIAWGGRANGLVIELPPFHAVHYNLS